MQSMLWSFDLYDPEVACLIVFLVVYFIWITNNMYVMGNCGNAYHRVVIVFEGQYGDSMVGLQCNYLVNLYSVIYEYMYIPHVVMKFNGSVV